MDDETKAALKAIDGKLDTLLKNNTDEQVAGILGHINRLLDNAWIQRAIVGALIVGATTIAGKLGYLTPEQQTKAAEVVIAASSPGSAPGVLAPQPVPVAVEPAPVVPADAPAPMAPTE